MFASELRSSINTRADDEWYPNEGPQHEALTRREFEIFMGGCRGGSKTETGIIFMAEPEYVEHPRYSGLVVRRNVGDLDDWVERARYMYRCLGARFSGRPVIIRFPAGGYIKTGHLKDENSYTKYVGQEYQKINIEELPLIAEEEHYLKLLGSCRSSIPELFPQCFSSGNPGEIGHQWVKARFIDCCKNKTFFYGFETTIKGIKRKVQRSRIFIPSSIDDTPQLYENDPGYVAFLESLPEELRRAWREGDWTVLKGQYYKKINKKIHLCDDFRPVDDWIKFRSLDWGFDHNTVCLWWMISPDDQAYIYRAYKRSGLVVPKMAAEVVKMTPKGEKISTTVASHDLWARLKEEQDKTNKTMADKCRKAGLFVEKAVTDRVNGWEQGRWLMEWDADNTLPTLQIFESCSWVLDDLAILIHDPKKPEDVLKMKGDDTGDAYRYGGMKLYPGRKPKIIKTRMQKVFDELHRKRSNEKDFLEDD